MSLFLRALEGENTPTAPIWMMRQAGRYLPEYMALKQTYSFWDMVRQPELAALVTLQPMRRFNLDAAIMFSDIMTPLVPMGMDIAFNPGPILSDPIRTDAQINALRQPHKDEIAPFMPAAIKQVAEELKASGRPAIGFAGAPLTLATYAIQGSGSKDYEHFRAFLHSHPASAHNLLAKLTAVTIDYLKMQIDAGVQAIQLFDSWAGLHTAQTYSTFALPYNQQVMQAIAAYAPHIPKIYLAVGASHLYSTFNTLECQAFSVDWRLGLSHIRPHFGQKTLQGNLDPAVLLSSPQHIKAEALEVLQQGLGGPHVFNLGHGISRFTPIENVELLIDTVHSFKR